MSGGWCIDTVALSRDFSICTAFLVAKQGRPWLRRRRWRVRSASVPRSCIADLHSHLCGRFCLILVESVDPNTDDTKETSSERASKRMRWQQHTSGRKRGLFESRRGTLARPPGRRAAGRTASGQQRRDLLTVGLGCLLRRVLRRTAAGSGETGRGAERAAG